jgi:hypothetical protein
MRGFILWPRGIGLFLEGFLLRPVGIVLAKKGIVSRSSAYGILKRGIGYAKRAAELSNTFQLTAFF